MSRLTHQIIAAAERAAALKGLDLDEWVDELSGAETPDPQARGAYAVAAHLARREGQDALAEKIEALADGLGDPKTFWSDAINGPYKPHKWGVHQAGHRLMVKEAMAIAAERAPECGDVIATLSFNLALAHNREEFLRNENAKERDALEARIATLEGREPRPGPKPRFGHDQDPIKDFLAEVDALAAVASSPITEQHKIPLVHWRFDRAMAFRTGADAEAVEAKRRLRQLERDWIARAWP